MTTWPKKKKKKEKREKHVLYITITIKNMKMLENHS